MKLKKIGLGLVLFLVLAIASYEAALCLQRGLPPAEVNPPQFDYAYIEIYKRFFKRISLPEGTVVYKPQRSRAGGEQFLAHKNKGSKRIFIIGGSVAMIFNKGIYLKELFEDLLPGMEFEVIGCGMGGYDSYRVSLIQKEILNYNPDLIILMSGNNEYYNPIKINIWFYRLNLLFRKLWVYRDLQECIQPLLSKNLQKKYNQISKKDLILNYENNLKTMIYRAKSKNVPMALCTLPVNFRDCPPPKKGDLLSYDTQFLLSWNCLQDNELEEAVKRFREFIAIHPEDSFAYYCLARSYDKMRDYPKAKVNYLKSLNLVSPGGHRCTPERNMIIRKLCAQEDMVLVDLEQAFIKIAPHGLVGSEFFVDFCHWWSEYDFLVNETIAQSIIEYNKSHSRAIFSPLSSWQYGSVLGNNDYLENRPTDLTERPFRIILNTMGYLSCVFLLDETVNSLLTTACLLNPNLFDDRPSLKKQIFKEFSSNDWTREFVPDFDKRWVIFLYHMGEVFRRLGLYSKAVDYLDESIRLKSDNWIAYLIRALAEYKLGQIEVAQEDFEEASRESNGHPLVKFYRDSFGI